MGDTTKTETVNKDPWAAAQPYLTSMMSDAQRLYGSGGSTPQAPINPDLAQSFDMYRSLAGNNTSAPYNTGTAVMGATQPALNTLGGISSGANGIDTGNQWQNVLNTIGPMANQPAVTTGGNWSDMYNRAGTMNAYPNSVFGNMAGTDAINTGGGYAQAGQAAGAAGNQYGGWADQLFGRTQGQNQDVYGTLGGVANRAGGGTAAEQYLSGMANSGGTSPYFQAALDAQNARNANRIAGMFSEAGRYGSAGNAAVLARTMGETSNAALNQQWDAEQARKLAATSQLDAARLGYGSQGIQAANALGGMRNMDTSQLGSLLGQAYGVRSGAIGQGLQALQGLSGVQGQNAAQRMGAAGALADSNRADYGAQANALSALGGTQAQNAQLQQSAAGLGINALQGYGGMQNQNIANQAGAANSMLGSGVQYAGMMPQLNALQGAGAGYLGNIGNYLQPRADQTSPWSQLQQYASMMYPTAGFGGTQTGSSTTPTPWTQYAGLGLAGANLFAPGAGGAPSAASGIGSALRSLAPMLIASDRTLKTDIKKLGTDEQSGLDMYAYRYKGDPKNYPKVVGPMAQDVEKAYPGSTERIGGKLAIRIGSQGLSGVF